VKEIAPPFVSKRVEKRQSMTVKQVDESLIRPTDKEAIVLQVSEVVACRRSVRKAMDICGAAVWWLTKLKVVTFHTTRKRFDSGDSFFTSDIRFIELERKWFCTTEVEE
jgi:hypothetical protein